MGWLMEPIYHGISWVLLRWHDLWHLIFGDGRFLGTTWSWVLAIVFLVVTVRLILFPIFVKQIKSQRAMQVLAPKVRELQAKHKGDPQTLREEMMKLYAAEKVNPLMGCLPMLLQIPVFFGLFHVLRYINPLAAQSESNPDGVPKDLYWWTPEKFDSAASAQLFTAPIPASFSSNADLISQLGGAHPFAAKLVAALLVVTMMFTTFVTSRQMIMKTGWQQEPQQRMIQKLMLYGIPISLLLSGWLFPIGVVIYWVTQNLVSLGQQQWVLRKYPPIVNTPATPKSARERAALANTKQPGAVKRFFLVLPPPETPTKGWFTKLMERTGLRKAEPEPTQTAPVRRALAPRPGAKPRVGTAASAGDLTGETEPVEERPSRGPAGTGKPIKAAPVKAAPVKGAPAKPAVAKTAAAKPAVAKTAGKPAVAARTGTGTKAASTAAATARPAAATAKPATATKPTAASPDGRGAVGSAPKQVSAANGSASANGAGKQGGGAGKQVPARKSTPARKGGRSGRKGGRR